MDVVIRGDGVAAYCCAYLLNKAGLHVALEYANRPRLPTIMLGEQALGLIRDVFGQPGILQNLPRIGKRVVAWGPAAKPISMQHSAVVVSEQDLLAAIRPSLIAEHHPTNEARCQVFAARPLPAQSIEHCFGSRMASAVPVTLKDGSDSQACRIESLDDGWLFLIPNSARSGWLLAIAEASKALLSQSRVVAPEIADYGPSFGEFPASPRIAEPLCGPAWLACGPAAMGFDPICGDGTAHAIREAILASAVIRALANGGPQNDLLQHYEARLAGAFQQHLAICRGFYQSGGVTTFWRSELDAIDRGIQWCDVKPRDRLRFRYRLRGFELEAVR
jgi:hypothetical protein